MNNTKSYIAARWADCVKRNTKDDGTLLGLPYPYTVPAVGHFDEMYYWDTYFTNVGLLISGLELQAKYNVDNMLYMVNRFGYMPNGNRTYYLGRSQPPFLSQMVREVYEKLGDKVWLCGSVLGSRKGVCFLDGEAHGARKDLRPTVRRLPTGDH